MATRYGGSFAPPLSSEKLASYKAAIAALPASAVKDALAYLLNCCEQWWEAPESTGASRAHPSGAGQIVDLDPPIAAALDQHIPWDHELDSIQGLLDAIPAEQKDLRNAAFHLLWHTRELALGREPITADLL